MKKASDILAEMSPKRRAKIAKRARELVCEGCGQNAIEEKGDLCPGCDAYRDHQC